MAEQLSANLLERIVHLERSTVGALGVHGVRGEPEELVGILGVTEYSEFLLVCSELLLMWLEFSVYLKCTEHLVYLERSSEHSECQECARSSSWRGRSSSWSGLSARSTPCCSAEQQHSAYLLERMRTLNARP